MKHPGILVAIAMIGAPAAAGEPIVVEAPSRIVIEVKEIVCSFCAYGARKSLARVDFLDRGLFKDGLLMETETGRITAAVQRGKAVDVGKVWKAVRRGGYEVLAVHLNLEGVAGRKDGATVLKNRYTGQEFPLTDAEGRPWDLGDLEGRAVTVQGVVPEATLSRADVSRAPPVRVKTVSASPDGPAPSSAPAGGESHP